MNQELSNEQKALLVLSQTLNTALGRGAFKAESEVKNYSEALIILEGVLFPKKEESKLEPVSEES